MSKLLIRHAQSTANWPHEVGVDNMTARLTKAGTAQAYELGFRLNDRGIDKLQPVAVSAFVRTQLTAINAGFNNLVSYEILDEAIHRPLTAEERRDIVQARTLPEEARIVAKAILLNPPPEDIWVTHALVIAGLCQELGVDTDERLLPTFCEDRLLDIP